MIRLRQIQFEKVYSVWPVCLTLLLHCGSYLQAAAQSPPPEAGNVLQDSAGRIRNVLFIVSDDLRASVPGCYGDSFCQTPNIDRLAKQGLVFDSAYCQGTVCGPSRTSFMYSRYRGRGTVTLGQHLKNSGYYSARVGKIFHMRVPGDIIAGTDGEDRPETWTERFNSPGQEAHTPGNYACLNLNIFTTELEGRQSTAMPHRMFVSVDYEGDGSDQPDHKTATKTIELLREHKDGPFFIAAGFVRPHYPMVAPQQYFEPYPWQNMLVPEQRLGDLDDIPELGVNSSRSALNGIDNYPDNQKRMWAAYYAAVTFMDQQVGRMLDELDRLGLRDSTAVIFTSDHGYHLGDHTFWQKADVHEQVIRVPLIMSVPGMPRGRSDSFVELVDLFPTVCELTSLETPPGLHGTSLVPILKDHLASTKEGALSFAKGTSWRTKDWAYIQYPDATSELYDMRNDPGQFTNLADDPGYSAIKDRLSQQLAKRLDGF
ncbi:MAG: sulfatase [Planctomycetaceae bacterium]|nr:sulfatase [Planctomycetaceae bacterium]